MGSDGLLDASAGVIVIVSVAHFIVSVAHFLENI
jgi:hypothetical protein